MFQIAYRRLPIAATRRLLPQFSDQQSPTRNLEHRSEISLSLSFASAKSGRHAAEIGGIVDAALACIARDLRVRTKRSGAHHLVVHDAARDH